LVVNLKNKDPCRSDGGRSDAGRAAGGGLLRRVRRIHDAASLVEQVEEIKVELF
jgi:hypothetical protein